MFTLLHSDPRFYLINKHPGVSFHREGEEDGLLDAVRAGLQDEALWPVHRLDRITSGLILLARSSQVASQFGSAFADMRWRNTIWRCRIANHRKSRG
jgi:tRNA pseudouridine32 synthase/23S rRNA pseudouridine746 synthase